MITIPAAQANPGSIRKAERESIQAFLERQWEFIQGRVLDFGCGRQPYRNLVESFGAEYVPFDRASHPASVVEEDAGSPPTARSFDTVVCTQVIQYYASSTALMLHTAEFLKPGGHLILTGPTCWDEVESEDYERLTLSGVRRQASQCYEVLVLERRAEVDCNGFKFPLGYGLVARA